MNEPEVVLIDRCEPESDCLHCQLSNFIARWITERPDSDHWLILADISQVLAEAVVGFVSPETRDHFLSDLDTRIRALTAAMEASPEHEESTRVIQEFVLEKSTKKAH